MDKQASTSNNSFADSSSDEAPQILLPVAVSVFAERAERFRSLAAGHNLSGWLEFLGHLSSAQHDALQTLPQLPSLPDEQFELARQHRMPPLNATASERPAIWRDVLRQIIAALLPHAPESSLPLLTALAAADDIRLEALADDLLHGEPDPAAAGELPLIAAALQVVWTAQAARLSAAQLQKLDTPGVCPCCGSLPVASIVRLSSTVNNLRYLHCSLCNTQWNAPRATCTACGGDKELALQQIEDSKDNALGKIFAETCDNCRSYLKIVYQEKDPRVDPVADDLATLALDLLVDEAGYGRSGPNLLLINTAG